MSVAVVLYGAPDCTLCEEAKELLASLSEPLGFDLKTVDISADEELERRFRTDIPVVYVAGRRAFKYRVDPAELRRRLLLSASQTDR